MQEFIGLGLDAGGTQTRVALVRAREENAELLLDASIASLHASLPATPEGEARTIAVFDELVAILRSRVLPMPNRIVFGLTGYDDAKTLTAPKVIELLRRAFANPALDVQLENDVECLHRALFSKSLGHVLYAGTGAIAVHIDANNVVHRIGGHGNVIGDEGGAYWIAKTALASIWRRGDETPGTWRESPLARAMFEQLGGSDWSHTRALVARNDRGEIGLLARTVAACADNDPLANEIIEHAAVELARLAIISVDRFGSHPVALAGGAFKLHPLLAERIRGALAEKSVTVFQREISAHVEAAKRAATRFA